MLRTGLLVSAIAVVCYVVVNLLVTTDLERVEDEIHRLVEFARTGGDDAVDKILGAFADDYRGSVDFDWIQGNVRNFIGRKRFQSVEAGSFKTVWKGDEILIPLLTVRMKAEGWQATMLLTVTCAERDGKWKIVHITRTRWG